MKTNRSLLRVAALTGVAAFLFSFTHVNRAAAQTSTRHISSCQAFATVDVPSAECNIYVPPGKVFIVESANFGGYAATRLEVKISTKKGNSTYWHHIPPADFQPGDFSSTYWTAALPGTVFSEGDIRMRILKQASTHQAWIRMTLSGHLEDM